MRYRILASLGLALVSAPALADAQQTGQRGQQPPDSTRAGQVRSEARGDVALEANRGLSRTQVRQLQESLRSAGCNPGTPDGVFGPRTRQALACVRRQRGIESTNANDVLRALNLGFTLNDSVAVAGEMAMSGERRTPVYSDPTFVRDTGVITIDADTMPAGLLESNAVFVPSVTRSRGLYLRETSLDRRSTDVLVPRDTTGAAGRDSAAAVRRPPVPAVRRDTTPTVRRDTLPAARRDSTPAVRRDTAATTRADSTRLLRADSLARDRARRDSARTALPDTTLRRMRDEILFSLPPRADTLRADSTRTRPDSTRVPPDTTRRRIPPPR